MVDMTLLAAMQPEALTLEPLHSSLKPINGSEAVLARSRRPTIMTYSSRMVESAHVLANLPWMVFGWKKESEAIQIEMFEGVSFSKGWKNVPDRVQIVIEADEKMQFYEASVSIHARFRGLRYAHFARFALGAIH
jgi:seipin